MKIRTMIVMLLIGIVQSVSGQCLWDNNKGIVTPFSNKNTPPPMGSSIETFRWLNDKYYVYTQTGQTAASEIWSPFSSNNNASANINGFIVSDPKDNDPNEGWELILKNFGTSGDPYPNPTMVLYNRFSSILRVFIYVPQSATFNRNTAQIDLKFFYFASQTGQGKIESALLAPLSTPLMPLENFKKKIAGSAIQRTQLNGLFWMYADFPVAYDPCTCRKLTAIQVVPNFINIQEVNLLASVQKKNLTASGTSSPDFISTLSHAFNYFSKATEAGKKKGVQVGQSVKDVSNFLDQNVLPKFDYKTRVLTVSGSPDDDIIPFEKDILRTFRVPEIVKVAAPQLGTVLGILEYITTSGKSTAVSAASVNYEINGTITDSIPGQNSIIYVPGSKWIGDPSGNATKFKPIYNNTLGTFSVLETPKLDMNIKFLPNFGSNYPMHFLTYKLNIPSGNVLKYVINPASGLKSNPSEIKCSLIAKFKKELYSGYNGAPGTPKVSSLVSSIISEEKGSNMVIVQSPLMSLDCMRNFPGLISCADCKINDIEFRLQVVATLEGDDNSGKKTFFSAQYQLASTVVSSVSLPPSDDDIAYIPFKFAATDINLTGNKTIRAWDNISVKGTINTNGFKLTLIAGSTVNINPTSITPSVDIQIGYPANCNNFANPVAASDVSNFCSSTKYNPVVPLPLAPNTDVSRLKGVKNMTTSLSVAPNPFNNQLSIQYELQEATQVTVSLSNALGQVVKVLVNEKVEAGSYQINESTADLPSGVYIVTMKTPTGMKTQKVVKQNN
jgi:Secretion system C-terminal sorting domain